jgi:hypothetical protein
MTSEERNENLISFRPSAVMRNGPLPFPLYYIFGLALTYFSIFFQDCCVDYLVKGQKSPIWDVESIVYEAKIKSSESVDDLAKSCLARGLARLVSFITLCSIL